MPAVVRSEFALALHQVATERGIDINVVVETIKAAILAAYRKDYGADEIEQVIVELNPDTGEAKLVKEGTDVTPPGFGRIAAQTAKQVILQRIREAEKQAVLSDFQMKVGSIAPGMVLRFDGPNIIVDIGRTQAVMPPQEQNQNERYHLNQRLTFYIEGIREGARGSDIVVSRAHKGLVEGLFKREVPEVAQGAVELRVVAREAGGRTKVAVFSTQSGVDPVGSCVGQKGVRVQAVINELGGNEKVDIIQWSEDARQFITAALAPAKDMTVALDDEKKIAIVTIPEDQLSLAIGRDGQNVRLAAKLTNWKIDIRGKAVAESNLAPVEAESNLVAPEEAETASNAVSSEAVEAESNSVAPEVAETASNAVSSEAVEAESNSVAPEEAETASNSVTPEKTSTKEEIVKEESQQTGE